MASTVKLELASRKLSFRRLKQLLHLRYQTACTAQMLSEKTNYSQMWDKGKFLNSVATAISLDRLQVATPRRGSLMPYAGLIQLRRRCTETTSHMETLLQVIKISLKRDTQAASFLYSSNGSGDFCELILERQDNDHSSTLRHHQCLDAKLWTDAAYRRTMPSLIPANKSGYWG